MSSFQDIDVGLRPSACGFAMRETTSHFSEFAEPGEPLYGIQESNARAALDCSNAAQ
jgi:hypothetical protein